uniref:Uncharacterized protein n=1 Tax=Plectus sambesii TaxID=2011161 RepID=A0A914VXX4_9BILA
MGTISNQTRIEFRMALMGAVIFVVCSFYFFFTITSLLAPSVMQSILDLRMMYFLTADVMSSVHPFTIISMSKAVRSKCLGLLCGLHSSGQEAQRNSTRLKTKIVTVVK